MADKHTEEQYDWLNDPFDEKKNAQAQQAGMSGRSKMLVGIGCVGVVVVLALMLFMATGLLGAMML